MNKYIKDYEIALKYAFTNRTHDDTLDALIAAVNAEPHDIGARAALSDELEEKGHFHDMPEAHRNLIQDYEQPKHVWVNRQGQVRALPHKTPLESDPEWHSMLGQIHHDYRNHELYTQAANWLDENGHAGLSGLFNTQANILRGMEGGKYDWLGTWGLPYVYTISRHAIKPDFLNTHVGKGFVMPLADGPNLHSIDIVTDRFLDRVYNPPRLRTVNLTDYLTDEEAADIKHSLEQ